MKYASFPQLNNNNKKIPSRVITAVKKPKLIYCLL